MGKYLGSVLCIHHRDSNASMGIYTDGDKYNYYCFGCGASGYLDEDEVDDLLAQYRTGVVPKVVKELVRELSPQAKEFLASRNIESRWYKDYGIGETIEGYLYLPCYDYNRVEIGCQLRDIIGGNPKIWSCPDMNGYYPCYSVIYGYERQPFHYALYRKLIIVESILDGLSLWSRLGYMSVALLGTNPSQEFFKFINTHVDKKFNTIQIVFDPDNPGQEAAIKLVDKLRVLGYNVSNVCLEDVVYRVNKNVLEESLG